MFNLIYNISLKFLKKSVIIIKISKNRRLYCKNGMGSCISDDIEKQIFFRRK